MYRVESLKLFDDISKVSNKYKSWHLKYFDIYENVALNSFITFLSLIDMNIIKQENLNDLSQAIFTQIQDIAISSI